FGKMKLAIVTYAQRTTRTESDLKTRLMKTLEILEVNEASPQGGTCYPNRYSPIPPNGENCTFTGLKHAKLYHLLGPTGLARPHVRVVNLKAPGTKRGKTLFHVGDMLKFLDDL